MGYMGISGNRDCLLATCSKRGYANTECTDEYNITVDGGVTSLHLTYRWKDFWFPGEF